eukprot:1024680-Rhodomonas_salina.1
MSASSAEVMAYEEAAEAGGGVLDCSSKSNPRRRNAAAHDLHLLDQLVAPTDSSLHYSHVRLDHSPLLLHLVPRSWRPRLPVRRSLHRPPLLEGDRCRRSVIQLPRANADAGVCHGAGVHPHRRDVSPLSRKFPLSARTAHVLTAPTVRNGQ